MFRPSVSNRWRLRDNHLTPEPHPSFLRISSLHSAFLQVSESMPSRLLSFLKPLAAEIWLYMFGAYVVVSLTIWVVARFSPYEWSEPNPCRVGGGAGCDCPPPPPSTVGLQGCHATAALLVIENDFTPANSFWFTIGTLMQQGSDLNPKVVPWSLVRYSYRFIPNLCYCST
jgi:ionotropic kainate glutamate receptor 2